MTARDRKGRPLDGLEVGFGYPAGMTAGKELDDMPDETAKAGAFWPAKMDNHELAAELRAIANGTSPADGAALPILEAADRLRAADKTADIVKRDSRPAAFRQTLEWIAAHKLTAEGAKPKNAQFFRDAIVVEARQALEDADSGDAT